MTVGQLKEELEKYPDDMEVWGMMGVDAEPYPEAQLCVRQVDRGFFVDSTKDRFPTVVVI